MPKLKNPVVAFWQNVEKTTTCWLWWGYRNKEGYGVCKRNGVVHLAHRLAFFYTYGVFPEVVMHKCDITGCVNPDHLVAGTQLDNVADAVKKGHFSTPARISASRKNQKVAIAARRKE